MTLGMIWTIILRFAIQDISVEGESREPADWQRAAFSLNPSATQVWGTWLDLPVFCLHALRLFPESGRDSQGLALPRSAGWRCGHALSVDPHTTLVRWA